MNNGDFSMKTVEDFVSILSNGQLEKQYLKINDSFDILSQYIFEKDKILVAVSGGPDSIFLSVLIYNYYVENNFDLNNLFFVHCNHGTRAETDEEQKFVERFFGGFNLYVFNRLDFSQTQNDSAFRLTENNLRNWRYGEFQKIIDRENINFVLTGHNLTDRIESSFMNMFRGSGLNGFRSMKYLDKNNLIKGSNILRPLLSLTKKEIERYCDNLSIPYVVDPTNLDQKTSVRNKIRLSLFPQLSGFSNLDTGVTNTFFESMQNIYEELDKKEDELELIEIKKSGYWNSQYAFEWNIPTSFVDEELLLRLFKKFNISSEITKNTLNDFVNFIRSGKQGYKNVNGVYLFLSHSKLYIIKAKENFWQKYVEKSQIIDKLGMLIIGKEQVDIVDKDLIGLEIRYPKQGDKIGSKSWSKYCINQKIPMFWRNFIPVVVRDNEIIKYFY